MPISTISNAGIAAGAGISTSKLGTGAVLQVVQAQKTDTFSTSSTSFVDVTGLSVSITPTSASNKILVFMSVSFMSTQHSDLRIVRDSTAIAIGDASGSITRSTAHTYRGFTNGEYDTVPASMVWLDSPSTTSATTYKIQTASPYSGAYVAYINRTANAVDASYNARTVSSITVMEIAA